MVAADEALVDPRALEVGDQVLEGDQLPAGSAAVVLADRFMDRRPVDDTMVAQQRHAQDVSVLVLQRTEIIVVDLPVGEEDGLVGRDQSLQALLAVPPRRVPVMASTGEAGKATVSAAGRSRASSTNRLTLRDRTPP